MKILMLCELYIENLEYQENLLVKFYRKHGHEVTVITSTYDNVFDYYNDKIDNSKPARTYYDHGAKIFKLPFKYNILGKIKKFKDITKIVEDFQPDLLYVHDIMPNMFEMLAYKKRNPHVKMIMDYHADYTNSANNWLSLHFLHKIIRKYLYMNPIRKHISRFYPIIPGSAQFLNEVYGIPESEMEVLPLGADVDLAAEIRDGSFRNDIRKQLNIKDTDKVLFTGGKFAPLKRTELVLEVFNEINAPDLHLIIVGEADENTISYKEKLMDLAVGKENIHFVGWLNNRGVYEHLAASDIAVFPSSQSIIWLQALASHLPIIIGDFGNQSLDYLNEYGAVIELELENINVKNFKREIEKQLIDENLRQGKLNAAKTAAKYLDWNNLIKKTLSHVEIS